MGTKKDHLATVKDLETLLFGITFPIACILCILILVQRIRRRPLARYAPPAKRQMDPPPNYEDGGKEEIDAVGHDLSSVGNPSRDVTSLPSACDILQPLSHLTSLPSSGYLATVLGRERRARTTTTTAPQRCLAEGEAQASLADPLAALPVPVPVDGDATASHRRRANSDMDASRRGSSDESCAELEDPQSFAFSPTGWRRGDGLGDGPSPSTSNNEGPAQQVEKRTHTVQYLHTVDEEGPRAWRRVMMEYS